MRAASRQSGFTVIEILVAGAIFSVVALAISTMYMSNQTTYALGQSRIEIAQNARVGIEQMERELRMAGKDPANTIQALAQHTAMQTATATSITFVADVDHDRVLDQVTYRLSGTQLIRDFSTWGGSSFPSPTSGVVADGLTSLTFNYYDDAQPTNNEILAPVSSGTLATIKRVVIGLTTTKTTIGTRARTFFASVDVKLRNV